MVVISVSWKELQKMDGRCSQDAHSQYTFVQYSQFTSAERTPRAWIKPARLNAENLCAHEKCLSSDPHMSHPFLFSHLPRTTSTSSSSFTLPSTTTPEHALQWGQHDLLQEHPVHHQPLQERPIEKHRYQEPLLRENQQSGGNLRTTFTTISVELLGESGESQPTDATDDAEARADFWLIQCDFLYRHHNEL